MRLFRALWLLHRWLGITLGLVLMLSAVTGFLLLRKKDHEWLQPTMMRGEAGPAARLQPLPAVYAAVFALGVPEFRSESDIARIDFRPAQRVHKVISKHDDLEVQVCAITLRTQGPAPRRSDLLERLHDGSYFGDFAHGALMPLAAITLLFLATSGYVMWAWPKWLRWRRRQVGPPSPTPRG